MENKEIKLFVVSHKELNSDYYPDRTIIYVGQIGRASCRERV